MNEIKDGGPVFPQTPGKNDFLIQDSVTGKIDMVGHRGISIRDYFAAQALTALVHSEASTDRIAQLAYQYADAMLAERSSNACNPDGTDGLCLGQQRRL